MIYIDLERKTNILIVGEKKFLSFSKYPLTDNKSLSSSKQFFPIKKKITKYCIFEKLRQIINNGSNVSETKKSLILFYSCTWLITAKLFINRFLFLSEAHFYTINQCFTKNYIAHEKTMPLRWYKNIKLIHLLN